PFGRAAVLSAPMRAEESEGPDEPTLRLGGSAGLQVGRGVLAAARIFLQLETDLLAFVKRSQAGAFHCRDVNEDVAAAVVGLDEAEALLAVEPLDCAGRHRLSLSGRSTHGPTVGAEIKFSERVEGGSRAGILK